MRTQITLFIVVLVLSNCFAHTQLKGSAQDCARALATLVQACEARNRMRIAGALRTVGTSCANLGDDPCSQAITAFLRTAQAFFQSALRGDFSHVSQLVTDFATVRSTCGI